MTDVEFLKAMYKNILYILPFLLIFAGGGPPSEDSDLSVAVRAGIMHNNINSKKECTK